MVNWLDRARRELGLRRKPTGVMHVAKTDVRWWIDHDGNVWLNTDVLRRAPLTDAEIEEIRRQAAQITPGKPN